MRSGWMQCALLLCWCNPASSQASWKIRPQTKEDTQGTKREKDFHSQRFPQEGIGADGETIVDESMDQSIVLRALLERLYNLMMQNLITRPPRDLWQGFLNAINNLYRGYWNGCHIVWEHGVEGFRDGGPLGLVEGTVGGLVSGVAVVAGGIVASVSQLIQGAYNTPMAFAAPGQGKTWDDDEGHWRFYSLDEEVEMFDREMANNGNDHRSQNLRQRSNRKVKETEFYRMLKVPTDATSSEIKRAYYKEALKVHPDKNKDDQKAAEKFEQLSTAYQVLAREDTRESYDAFGKCSLKQQEQSPFLDAHVFFDVMFGSRLVEPYVGELQIASLVDDFLSLTDVQSIKQKSTYVDNGTRQKKRVLNIALHLRKSIEKFVDGQLSEAAFRRSCRVEAVGIANGDFGDDFLMSIGRSIETPAKNFIAKRKSVLQGTTRTVATTTDNLVQTYHTTSAFLQSMVSVFRPLMDAFAQHKSAKKDESPFESNMNPDSCDAETGRFQVDTTVLMRKLERSIPKAFRLIRQLNDRDINRTLKAACNKVIADGRNMETSLKRANGLKILGEIFFETGSKLQQGDRWKDDAYINQIIKKAYSAASAPGTMEEFYD